MGQVLDARRIIFSSWSRQSIILFQQMKNKAGGDLILLLYSDNCLLVAFQKEKYFSAPLSNRNYNYLIFLNFIYIHLYLALLQSVVSLCTLHLPHCEVCVQPVNACQQQHLGWATWQKLQWQALEPPRPKLLSFSQVYSPGVFCHLQRTLHVSVSFHSKSQ